ncbi:MAG: outer membrane lipoprotein-sorting protein, partial [Verrucomicrobiota bacterium]
GRNCEPARARTPAQGSPQRSALRRASGQFARLLRTANSLGDTYAMIKYWVTNGENLGKKAEFYAKSGTILRTSTMEYNNKANGRPFLSKMVVKDSSKTITLQFSNVRIGSYPSRMFEREYLGGPKSKGGPKG